MADIPEIITYDKVNPFNGKTITIVENENLSVFDIKRLYWINYCSEDVTKSEHAHKSLKQIIIAIEGEIKITLEDPDGKCYNFVLNNPSQGLFIPARHWKVLDYYSPCTLLCLASEVYDENDYIRSYEEFKTLENK